MLSVAVNFTAAADNTNSPLLTVKRIFDSDEFNGESWSASWLDDSSGYTTFEKSEAQIRGLSLKQLNVFRSLFPDAAGMNGATTRLRNAIETMRAGSAALDEGREDINTINRFLEDIQGSVSDVANRVEEITGWTVRQATDADKLVANADEIAKAAEDNAAATQEVTAATEEQMASMEEMALSAQDLLRMAEKLESVASRFRVK